MSINIAVVAMQSRGKSNFIKLDFLPKFQGGKRENWIFDFNNEYDFENKLWDKFDELPEMQDFLHAVPCETDSFCNVIFEEATGFFSKAGTQNKKVFQHVTRIHHTKNINVFVFHSLVDIPEQVRKYMDFIHLWRTDDDPLDVEKEFKSFPKIIEMFYDIREKTENTFFNRRKKTYPDEHSKKWFHYKRIYAK